MVYMSMSGSETVQNRPARSRADMSRLLELRRTIKARTPEFQRQESWRYVRIHDPWRKPKGIDSHMRLSVKGWPVLVKVGYRGPKKVRGLHPSGYRDVLAHNLVELEALLPSRDAARLAAGVGRKKKIELAKRAKVLGIRVLNGRGLLFGLKTVEEGEESSAKKEPETTEEKVETSKKRSSRTQAKKKRGKLPSKSKKPKKGKRDDL